MPTCKCTWQLFASVSIIVNFTFSPKVVISSKEDARSRGRKIVWYYFIVSSILVLYVTILSMHVLPAASTVPCLPSDYKVVIISSVKHDLTCFFDDHDASHSDYGLIILSLCA